MMQPSCILLIAMALMLGVQHGFDLDHLATIDSVTRTVSSNRHLSQRVGLLFSFGHGLVVICISFVVGSGMIQTHIPKWLDNVGNWISIIFLFMFGILNLLNVLHTQSSLPTNLKQLLSKQFIHQPVSPLWIILIGALFALSFDTFSQVALFSISATVVSGYLFSLMLGIIFMLGMMASDGINGLLVSALIQRADGTSTMVSRVASFMIASFSLIIGIMKLSNMLMNDA